MAEEIVYDRVSEPGKSWVWGWGVCHSIFKDHIKKEKGHSYSEVISTLKVHFPKKRNVFNIVIWKINDTFNQYFDHPEAPYRKSIPQQAFNNYSSIL